MEASKNSYFNGLREYQKNRSSVNAWLVGYAEDMDNWSELREESEDLAVRATLRRKATERKFSV